MIIIRNLVTGSYNTAVKLQLEISRGRFWSISSYQQALSTLGKAPSLSGKALSRVTVAKLLQWGKTTL